MRTRSIRGMLLVLGIFLLGGAVLGGLFLAPRPHAPPTPPGVESGLPLRNLRFVSYNILHNQRGLDRVAGEIKKLEPDFVFLQEVESADAAQLAQALGMEANYYPQLYHTSENLAGQRASWGNLILSKYSLYAAESIPNPGGGSFGVWSDAVVDGKRFVVANVHLSATWNANPIHIKQSGMNRAMELTNLRNAWKARGSPPIIVGGDFNQIPTGNNYVQMTQDWTDALAALGKKGTTFGEGLLKTRIDYFLLSPGWKPIDAEIVSSDASDHRPIRLTVGGKPPPTTAPTTTAPGNE
jgi:endonuclease/exonuclease/phosphatase family metal-dependent hydrolase